MWSKIKSNPIIILLSIILSIIFGFMLNIIINNWSNLHLDLSHLPVILINFTSLIIFLLVLIYFIYDVEKIKSNLNKYFQRIDNKLENTLEKLVKQIPCSILTANKQKRLKKIQHYINEAEKQIYIFSDLSYNTELPEHQNYLKELNQKLENKEIKFLRIVVPNFDISEMKDDDIIKEIKGLPTYNDHFNKIFEHRENEEALILDKNGEKGISILLIDERFIILILKREYKHPVLNKILRGGFFLEDIEKGLTAQFKDFFEGKKNRIVID